MNKTKPVQSTLQTAKNLARGALSILRQDGLGTKTVGRGVEKTPAWVSRQVATGRLNKAIETARKGLSQSDLRQFNSWLEARLPVLDSDANRIGVRLSSLGILPKELLAQGLDTELSASIERLKGRKDDILHFAQKAKIIADEIGKGHFPEALAALTESLKIYGHSFWYIESLIAVTKMSEGIEKSKKLAETLSIGGSGHQKFLFYYFGVRNEPAQSALRFRSNVKKVIDDSILTSSLKTYLKYRLYRSLESRAISLADVLAYEQNNSLIDLFFTIVKVSNLILSQKRAFPQKVIYQAERVQVELCDAIAAISICINKNSSGTEQHLMLAVQVLNLLFDNQEATGPNCEDFQAISAVASQLSTRGDQLQSDEASKAFINMSWLPVADAIGEVQEIPSLPELLILNEADRNSTPFLSQLHNALIFSNENSYSDTAKKSIRKIRRVDAFQKEGKLNDLVSYISRDLADEKDGNIEDALIVIYADALLKNDQLMECVSVCAKAGRINDRLLPLLPFGDLFVGKRWNSIRIFGPSLDLAIALSHASRVIQDGKLKTFKRFSTEELLVSFSCMTVDELIPKLALKYEHDEVAYFGYHVCDIPTIELLPGMGESKTVRYARVRLLRQLAELHTNRKMSYLTEAQALDDALQVDDGLSVLDDSKVHVDEEAVIDYICAEYPADFQRYKKLVESGIGRSESLTDILKNLDSPSARLFQIPKNDADDLLVQLINNIMHRFLYDPASGLDIIIGRRIRHNTISSELRGYLEKCDLIGTIHLGKYQPSPSINKISLTLDGKRRKMLFAANARFSESIDQLVALLRDQYFNVKSKSKPRGVFELNVHPVLFAVLRVAAQVCDDLQQFARECIDTFWLFLSFKLDVVSKDIEAECKKNLKVTFQKFSAELASQKADLLQISAVQRAAEELQRRAVDIASWISVPKVRLESKTHSLSKTIDIAVAVVAGQVPGFDPKVSRNISTDIKLDNRGFALVSDALYVAMGNIAQHSGKKINNEITVGIDMDSNNSMLIFEIVNDVAPSARKPEKIQKMDLIRSKIQRRTVADGARKNKHSGLFKLAAIVHQSEKAEISFGFIGKERFYLKFSLLYVPLNTEEFNS
ncbi:hypothetical protein [Janthinobacterium sp. SUN137]|uniref:hypothetical protein n=1 Tax=Janthinobacterium sp. SUN137 TaxID=3014789 RepID=UPI002712A9AA|nr:hypothetical protein [Janthinobacterium sp. SUN137]MDO8040378.1 hypothetical protein [Janthinobacterium sp. SUN137]